MAEARGKILIVDDEESIRDILSRKLQSEGFDLQTAADGKEALWKLFMEDYALVLMDIKMPGLSGMEALPRIITDHPDTCVVMITAVADIQTAVQAMKLGALDYLTKPFNLDDLLIRVERALERRRLLLENKEYQQRLEQRVERQVGQIQQYQDEALGALSREQAILAELDAMRALPLDEAAAAAESAGETANSVRELGRKLSQIFGSRTPDAEEKATTGATQASDAADRAPDEEHADAWGEAGRRE
jgi:DNA-binding response OmpR family regulator